MDSRVPETISSNNIHITKEIYLLIVIIVLHLVSISISSVFRAENYIIFFLFFSIIEILLFTVYCIPKEYTANTSLLTGIILLEFLFYITFLLIVNRYFLNLFFFDTKILTIVIIILIGMIIFESTNESRKHSVREYYRPYLKSFTLTNIKTILLSKEFKFILLSFILSLLIRVPFYNQLHSNDVMYLIWQSKQIIFGKFDFLYFDFWTLFEASPFSSYPIGSVLLMSFNVYLFPNSLEMALFFYNVICLMFGITISFKFYKLFHQEDSYAFLFSIFAFNFPYLLYYTIGSTTSRFPAMVFIYVFFYLLVKYHQTKQIQFFILSVLSWLFSLFLHRMNLILVFFLGIYVLYLIVLKLKSKFQLTVNFANSKFLIPGVTIFLIEISYFMQYIFISTLQSFHNPISDRFHIPALLTYNINFILVYYTFFSIIFVFFLIIVPLFIYQDIFTFLNIDKIILVLFIPFFIFIGRTDYAGFLVSPFFALMAVIGLKYFNTLFKEKFMGLTLIVFALTAYTVLYQILWADQGVYFYAQLLLFLITFLICVLLIKNNKIIKMQTGKYIIQQALKFEKSLFLILVFLFFILGSMSYSYVQVNQYETFPPHELYITNQVKDIVNFMDELQPATFSAYNFAVELQIAAYLGWPFLGDFYQESILLNNFTNQTAILHNRVLKPPTKWSETFIFDVSLNLGNNITLGFGGDLYRTLMKYPVDSPIGQYIIKNMNLRYFVTDSSGSSLSNNYRDSTVNSTFILSLYSSNQVSILHKNDYFSLWKIF